MINYREVAQEWLHNVIAAEAEQFGEKFQHIEESMQLDHGAGFSMDKFVSALNEVEQEIYEVLQK
jgi:hypothetical protein